MSMLYDCSAFYKIVNYCYSHTSTEASRKVSALTAENMDKLIHLIYTNGRRNGILEETSLRDMLTSFNTMLKATGVNCENLPEMVRTYIPSCRRMIENVSKQPFNDGQKPGSLGGYVPASFRSQ